MLNSTKDIRHLIYGYFLENVFCHFMPYKILSEHTLFLSLENNNQINREPAGFSLLQQFLIILMLLFWKEVNDWHFIVIIVISRISIIKI